MKNLKRILSLALASVMVMGMMVVSASAKDTFTDQDAISNKHVSAVELVKALGIMNGKEGEKFDPQGTFTRAEMATVIATIHNKGVPPTFAKKVTPTYSDVPNSHWAASYIEYCTNFGLVGGVGGGKFDPEAPASATMTARMLLNLLGYTVPTGADWALTTEIQARQEDIALYDRNLTADIADPGKSIKREQVAQMISNALNLDIVDGEVVSYTVYKLQNKTGETGITSSMAAMTFTSASDAKAVANAAGVADGKFEIVRENVNDTETLATKYLSMTRESGILTSVKLLSTGTHKGMYEVVAGSRTYWTDEDICSEMIGRPVSVLFKGGDRDNVYGVTASGSLVFDGTVQGLKDFVEDMDEDEAAILNATTAAQWNNPDAADTDWKAETASYGVKVYRTGTNRNTGAPIYGVTVIPYNVRQIVDTTNTTVTLNAGVASSVNLTKKNITIYDDAAEGDWVMVTAAANSVSGKIEIAEAEVNEGVAADAYRTVSGVNQVRIDGEWVSVANATDYNILKALTKDATYNAVMVNGYIVALESASTAAAASKDMIFVVKTATINGGLDSNTYQARVITKEGKMMDIDLRAGFDEDTIVGKWCTYKVRNDVYYDLTPVATGDAKAVGFVKTYDKIFWDASEKALTSNTTKMNLADDAVVIFYHDDGNETATTTPATVTGDAGAKTVALEKLDVVTGKEIKVLKDDLGTASSLNMAFTQTVGGIEYVKFVFIADNIEKLPGATGSEKWGYVLTSPIGTANGWSYKLWNGTEEIDVTDETDDATAANGTSKAARGDVIKYEDLGNGKVAYKDEMTNSDAKAITGYNAEDEIMAFDGVATNYNIAENVTILYIDMVNREGVANGRIQLATESASVPGVYTKNAYVKISTDVTVLVIEVNNRIRATGLIDAIATPAADTSLTGTVGSAEIKAKNPGVYDLANATGKGAGITSAADADDLIAFLFTARNSGKAALGDNDKQKYTLTVTNKSGVVVYEETATTALNDGTQAAAVGGTPGAKTDAKYFFYVDKTGAHLIAGSATPTKPEDTTDWVLFDTAANGAAYTYTVRGEDGIVYGTGSFKL